MLIDRDTLLAILERWFELLCFATAFYFTLRTGFVNVAFAGVAGVSAFSFIYIANGIGQPNGVLWALLCMGGTGVTCLCFTALVRLISRYSRQPDLLVSLFMLYILIWIERLLIHLGTEAEVQQQRTPKITPPEGWSDFLLDPNLRLLWLCLLGIPVIALVFGAIKNTPFNYRTEVFSYNPQAILLRPNKLAVRRDVWIATGIAAFALAWWIFYDIGLSRGLYEPGRYLQVSFLGLAAAVCTVRSAVWLFVLCLLPALGEELFYNMATGEAVIPSSAMFFGFGLLIAFIAGVQYLRYGRMLASPGGFTS